jgi:DNA polymerase III delta prime subunit
MNINHKQIINNSIHIELELNWFKEMINFRLKHYFSNNNKKLILPPPPSLKLEKSNFHTWIIESKLDVLERTILISSIANIYCPEIFDKFLIKNKGLDKRFTEFGGKIDTSNSRFIPSLETISFILYGKNFNSTFHLQTVLDDEHFFMKSSAIIYSNNNEDNSLLSKTFTISDQILQFITTAKKYKPSFGSNFPAKLLSTDFFWNDLILSPVIMDEVENINTWIENRHEISSNSVLQKKINKGYKTLFYGPPGTGKTLTASLLGKKNNQFVYRVDLSQVISKYVGETEKNLAQLFNIAENKDWILFFDEAESLFSKRTSVSDSKDKFANQQTAYLLQRIEEYTGLVILATNLKPNLDRAFARRLQSQINFSIPTYKERRLLWINALAEISDVSSEIINEIAKDHILSGGSIKNIIQFAWLLSKRKNKEITKDEILIGIRRELVKEGKTMENNL